MGLGFNLNNKKQKKMKKTLSILMLTVCCALHTNAQLANGYYRVQNVKTDRYISIQDNNPKNYNINLSTQKVSMAGIRTIKPFGQVSTMPSTIIYLRNQSGNQYDLECQGTSIHEITGNRIFATLEVQSDGSYKAYGKYSGFTLYISDASESGDNKYLKNSSSATQNWWAKPVNTSDNYLGIVPDVEAGGKYYGTIYASFPFKLASSGMKAYYVSEASGSGFTMVEITDAVPAATPVIIECTSKDAASNMIEPVDKDVASLYSVNKLAGVYCDMVTASRYNAKIYDSTTQRVIGTSGGKLAFVTASSSDLTDGSYLRANKAYLEVPSGTSATLTLNGSTAIKSVKSDDKAVKEGTYTLTGVSIPEGVTPRPGIYIKNGKKIVIK